MGERGNTYYLFRVDKIFLTKKKSRGIIPTNPNIEKRMCTSGRDGHPDRKGMALTLPHITGVTCGTLRGIIAFSPLFCNTRNRVLSVFCSQDLGRTCGSARSPSFLSGPCGVSGRAEPCPARGSSVLLDEKEQRVASPVRVHCNVVVRQFREVWPSEMPDVRVGEDRRKDESEKV